MQSKILFAGPVLVHDAHEADTASIHKIYAHYVLNGLANFEEVPPTAEDMCSSRGVMSLRISGRARFPRSNDRGPIEAL
jgi:L-amino acid N-acyltransferase YncA